MRNAIREKFKGKQEWKVIDKIAFSSQKKLSGIYFENEGIRYSVNNPDFMFKDLDQKKNMHMRYTSELNKDEFEKIMSNYSPVSVVIVLSDGSEIVLRGKKIDEKINDMADLRYEINKKEIGNKVKLTFKRNNITKKCTIKLFRRQKNNKI